MRDIKFRAWDKHSKTMISWDEFWNKPYVWNVNLRGGGQDPDQPLMQYTGLKDKNGKEIYEGDIVKTDYGNKAVGWKESGACFWLLGSTFSVERYVFSGGDFINELEVIGNIWENSDLLERKNV